nr:E4 protein [Lemur mastadenovirus]WGN96547.1 E4 protein [Lemur mastadenovirus]
MEYTLKFELTQERCSDLNIETPLAELHTEILEGLRDFKRSNGRVYPFTYFHSFHETLPDRLIVYVCCRTEHPCGRFLCNDLCRLTWSRLLKYVPPTPEGLEMRIFSQLVWQKVDNELL